MKFEQKSFGTGPNSDAYRDNFDRIFKLPRQTCKTCGKHKDDPESCNNPFHYEKLEDGGAR